MTFEDKLALESAQDFAGGYKMTQMQEEIADMLKKSKPIEKLLGKVPEAFFQWKYTVYVFSASLKKRHGIDQKEFRDACGLYSNLETFPKCPRPFKHDILSQLAQVEDNNPPCPGCGALYGLQRCECKDIERYEDGTYHWTGWEDLE